MDVLDLRQLNRATLARQCLLERREQGVLEVLRATGGLQAQLPSAPIVGLWSRVAGFERRQLLDEVHAGRAVRGTTLRGTLHLHEVEDYRAMRPSLEPVLASHLRAMATRGRVRAEDLEPASTFARELLSTGQCDIGELRRRLAERFPGSEPQALGNVARCSMPLLLVPDPDAATGWAQSAPLTDARRIVGDQLGGDVDRERVARRFFEVLGPGTARDVTTWSGLTGMASVVRGLRDRGELVELVTWDGDELLDLPGAPRPSGDVPVPPRFLPMWDELLLSHADRSRVIEPTHKPFLASRNGMPPATYLVDGFVHGSWRIERAGGAATLLLQPFSRIPHDHEAALLAEGERLLAFLHPEADGREVRVG